MALVLPRLAPIFGRPTDDWRPVEINRADPTTLHLVSTDDPYLQGHAVIAPEAGIILEMATPSWTATFTPDGAVRTPLRRRWHAEFEI